MKRIKEFSFSINEFKKRPANIYPAGVSRNKLKDLSRVFLKINGLSRGIKYMLGRICKIAQ